MDIETAVPHQYSSGKPYTLFKADERKFPCNDWYGIYDSNKVNRLMFTDKPGAVFCVGIETAKRIEAKFNGLA